MNHILLKWPAFAVLMLAIFASCTKIDTTQLGTDLIPAVDNINTFETILPVVANNYIVDDSTRLNAGDAHVVGGITTDPVFGKTASTLFFEMKPASFPYLPRVKDSAIVAFDSAVLIINYLGYYGDSSKPVNLKLYEVNEQMQFDTLARPNYNIRATSSLGQLTVNTSKFWGEKSISAKQFKDSIQVKRGDSLYETVVNQLRIPLNSTLAKQLFDQDSAGLGVYHSDSTFKTYLRGFALVTEGVPEAIFYLSFTSSKLQFFYRQKNGTTVDTASSTLTFNSRCGHAIDFERDRLGSESNILASQQFDTAKGYESIYIQATPGTAGRIRILGVDTLKTKNRVIHRAELRVTQLGVNNETQLLAPNALYLDVLTDSVKNIYKGVPYDLSPYEKYYCYPSADISFSYFGGITRYEKIVGSGVDAPIAVYNFNLTRYLQDIVTRDEPLNQLRLSAPFYNFYENCVNGSTSYPQQVFPFTVSGSALNPIGRGRVKVAGSGPTTNANTRMQLRIIYSKL